MGFIYKKTNNRRALMERPDIIVGRSNFLTHYMTLKQEGTVFVYLDETWFYSKGYTSKLWQDDSVQSCVQKNLDQGKRYIVLHAGGVNGFVKGAECVFPSQSTQGDYHGTMTAPMCMKWMKEELVTRLEEPTTIVLDNASIHNSLEEKRPARNKEALRNFLTKHRIPFRPDMTYLNLADLASQVPLGKRFQVDSIIHAAGHQVICLRPYHCQYNPIELAWSDCKRYFERHVGNKFDNEHVNKIWKEALEQVTVGKWKNYVAHAEKIIEDDWKLEGSFDANEMGYDIIIRDDSDSDDDNEPLAVPLPGPSRN